MDPNSYQAYMFGQAGPENPYRFGTTPSKYVRHLAKVAPVGRSGAATLPAPTFSNSTHSPYETSFTQVTGRVESPSAGAGTHASTPSVAITRPATTPSHGANTRTEAPSLSTAGLAANPSTEVVTAPQPLSLTTAGFAATPSIAPDAGVTAPALPAGSNKKPSSPSNSPSRFPSPDATQLISSLANYQSLSDEALYDAALKAQQAMVKWQNEYKTLQKELNRMRRPPSNSNSKAKPKTNPRKFQKSAIHNQKHHDSLHQPTPNATQTTGTNPQTTTQPRTINPTKNPPSKPPRNELHIDMTSSMQPLTGKRTRKPPRILETPIFSAPPSKKPTSNKRAREEPEADVLEQQPPTKKRDVCTPPEWVRRPVARNGNGEVEGKDSARVAAARLGWAKRRAGGMDGRDGGKLGEGTVVKQEGK